MYVCSATPVVDPSVEVCFFVNIIFATARRVTTVAILNFLEKSACIFTRYNAQMSDISEFLKANRRAKISIQTRCPSCNQQLVLVYSALYGLCIHKDCKACYCLSTMVPVRCRIVMHFTKRTRKCTLKAW